MFRPPTLSSPEVSYVDQCLLWRRGISDTDIRAMASDYLRGDADPANLDAYLEYQHRWGQHTKDAAADKRAAKRAAKKRGRRYK